ncbi:MAG: hypothetical protein ABIK43_01600 [candidate division WOR-3 bacterium]
MSNARLTDCEQRTAKKQTAYHRFSPTTFEQRLLRRIRDTELGEVDRRKVLALCRQVYRVAHVRPGARLASAVTDAACGAVREGLRPQAAFRITGMALNILGLDLPVGVGRSLKQYILDGV